MKNPAEEMNEKSGLLNQIEQLKELSLPLELDEQERSVLLSAVNHYTEDYLQTLPQQKTYEINGYDRTDEDQVFEIDNEIHEIGKILPFISKRIDGVGLNPPSGGHFAYIPAGGLYTSALADYMVAVSNRYAGVFFASPGAVRLENALVRWTGKLIGYEGEFGGNLTSGGSIANLIAIAAAREAKQVKARDVEKSVVYACAQAHHSIIKSLKVAGLGECVLRMIDMDDHYRMDVTKLRRQISSDLKDGLKPFILFANAGSTDVGAVDPLEELAAVSEEYNLWFHVDAAYGGFFMLTDEGRSKMRGIHLADSVILDPHKGLFMPYGLGIVLIKNVHHLLAANSYHAGYMQDAEEKHEEYSPTDLSPEMSKHFRGMRMWLPLKLHGIRPFKASLKEKLLLTQYFYHRVRKMGFETGPSPDLSVVIFWYPSRDGDGNSLNKQIAHLIHQDGRVFISTTTIDGRFLLRFVALSFRTHLEHVNTLLDILEKSVKSLEGSSRAKVVQ